MLTLSAALSDNVFTRSLVDGRVDIVGADLRAYLMHPAEIFLRQLRYTEFDVSEMSLASFVRSVDAGDRRWVGLPVFPFRTFFHTWILIRVGSDIRTPADLKSRRIGLPEYPITGAVWTRGVLEHEFGVRPEDVKWIVERRSGYSHGGASGFAVPTGVDVSEVPPDSSLAMMVEQGAVDALAVPIPGRSKLDPSSGWTDSALQTGLLEPLFFDPHQERRRYLAASGLVHINHTIVVRRELIEEHPWLAPNLFQAFLAAKEVALRQGRDFMRASVGAGSLPVDEQSILFDPVPYGLESNALILATLLDYLREQSLISSKVALEDLFVDTE